MKLPVSKAGIRKHIIDNWELEVATPYSEPLSMVRKSLQQAYGHETLNGANSDVIDFIAESNMDINNDYLLEIPKNLRERWKTILMEILVERVKAKWKCLNK